MKGYDVIFLVDAGIGNVLQTLYAVEYLLRQKVSVGCYVGMVNASFKSYLLECYGETVIIDSLTNINCKYLVHGFTYQGEVIPKHKHYYFVSAEKHVAEYYSETEQFLNIVSALYPKGEFKNNLGYLKADYSSKVKALGVEEKIILYPGGSSVNSTRRWPYFEALMQKIGDENCLVVGGNDDLNFGLSYVYPKMFTHLPQGVLNRKKFWLATKKLGLLSPWSHHRLSKKENAHFNQFNWAELVALFQNAKKFVGNDGGLSHLAGACGVQGVVLFGPTSSKKNKPFNKNFEIIASHKECSPCQYGMAKVQMTVGFINCPYQVDCLRSISVEQVINQLNG